ncbi:MAG: type II toxin-antitoxin system HicB family antitoxin [Deltaproteobacteria bacterium]|nr:type II toxin-antitoxin system HicB family antitoxin [Deltaproteobacteria bacterium]
MTYNIDYEWDGNWWVASVREVEGCLTQGKSLYQARNRIQEALSGFVDDAEDATIEHHYQIERELRTPLDRALKKKEQAEAQLQEAQMLLLQAAKNLSDEHYPVRDIALLADLSHTRVQQLLEEYERSFSRPGRTPADQLIKSTHNRQRARNGTRR